MGGLAEEREEAVNPDARRGDNAGMGVHANDDFAGGTRDAHQLGDEASGRNDMVEDVDAKGEVELGVGERKFLADGANEAAGDTVGNEGTIGAHQRVEEDAAAVGENPGGAGGAAADLENARVGAGGGAETPDEGFVAGTGAIELVGDDAGPLPEAGFVALGVRPAVFGDGTEAGRKILFHMRVEKPDGLDCGEQCGTAARMGWYRRGALAQRGKSRTIPGCKVSG